MSEEEEEVCLIYQAVCMALMHSAGGNGPPVRKPTDEEVWALARERVAERRAAAERALEQGVA
jgi:hypothetical protein